jgi:cell pole-organizing protein PopZ
MSAINSNSDDRDLDAIHRAQRAHEPSMEEILASIRNIIAHDPVRGAAQEPPGPAPSPVAQMADSSGGSAVEGEPSEPREQPQAVAPAIVWRRPQAGEAEPAAGPVGGDEAPLLSPEANEAAALSFGALSASLEVRSAELADELVREMLRPMLKQWLDENLPSIVERLVRAEIQRVARGRR